MEALSKKIAKVEQILNKVHVERRTFMSERSLRELIQAVLAAPEQGALVETGCALGGSAAVIAATKEKQRPLFLYDVFGLIPAPKLRDGFRAVKLHLINRLGLRRGFQGDKYYGYRKDLLGEIQTFFSECGLPFDENNVKAIKGRYDKTLAAPVKFDVGLAHIDCDWYDSVMACLTALEPKIVKGGVLILDDYYAFPGCRDAVKDYFDQNGRRDRYSFIGQPEKAVMHIIQT